MGHEVAYARNCDIALAYRIERDGPIDLMFVPGFGIAASAHVR